MAAKTAKPKVILMRSLITSVMLAATLFAAGASTAQAMSGDKLLDELARTGSIVTTHGIGSK